MPTYRIYGNGDTREVKGFPRPADFVAYITDKIFSENDRRYRYTKDYPADVIVLTRKGQAYGHFQIERGELPTQADLEDYEGTKLVYIVEKSAIYENRLRPSELGLDVGPEGLEITKQDFDRIIEAAGEVTEYPQSPILDPRYCRICFNSFGWRRPTGTADEVTDSYYARHGFGHEEWLFNYEWSFNGYKYGFLQPFNNVPKHRGKWFSLKLFTNLGGRSFLAGTISNLYVPQLDELQKVYDHMEANNWVEQMRDDLRRLKRSDVDALNTTEPHLFVNVRFKQEDVTLYDPMPEFAPDSKPKTADRYKLLHDDDGKPIPTLDETEPPGDDYDYQCLRAAQQGMLVDLAHKRLQDKLFKWLCQKHGKHAVGKEIEGVDLMVTVSGGATFYEIKMETSAKKCIRCALGQLFEYSSYATASKAKSWIVVGDPIPTADDIAYLGHLRVTYNLPIYYARFDWVTGGLDAPV